MDFIDKPRNEFVGIMVLIVVEKGISCADSGNESAMVYRPSISFGLVYIFEKLI